jgi:hypothetical protein
MENGIGDGGGGSDNSDLRQALHTERIDLVIRFIDEITLMS